MASSKFRSMLIHTCTIYQRTEGSADSHGHPAITYPALATGVACLYMPKSHAAMPGGEKVSRVEAVLLEDNIIFMAYRVDFTEQDRIGNIADANGTVLESGQFNIRLIKNAAGQSHHLEIHVGKVGG